ncbi:putative quinol monooxygenase [Paraliomyxa miuraensis]|uniref:putative quinol monooxygenase n=1 Tax=Paraliomyxa miuraensis TaxID=376150 RepID=UPI0022558889|nr:putative quinol monooxygenase [Paraliomyxa miuraensis]MCX4240712.1 antibiotic biosynthesis monooxygenase [Paraliomyxa miuraensis]
MKVCTTNAFRVAADRIDELRTILEAYTAELRANEPGCLLYRVLQQDDEPTSFVVYAEFEDQLAYEAHMASDHVARLRGQIHPLMGDTHRKTVWRSFE